MSPAVVQKKSRAAAEAVHQQIQIAIAIDVREHGAGGRLIGAGDARFRGDLHKLPVAEVAIKRVGAVQAAKVEIAQAVAVHVPGSDAGAVQINLVRECSFLGKRIGKKNACLIRGKSSETGPARGGNLQCRRPEPISGFPIQGDGRLESGEARNQITKGDSKPGHLTSLNPSLLPPGRLARDTILPTANRLA